MKAFPFVVFALAATLSAPAFAQSGSHAMPADVTPSEARKAFDALKAVAGSWVGPVTTVPPVPAIAGKFARFDLRVSSMGNALVHELSISGRPDHPVTMFYVDAERLLLTHYCDAGNRPRMVGRLSPDGRTLEFDFLDLSGGNEHGHMHHAVFTFIDADHHTEDWTFMVPGDQAVRAHFDLQRTNAGSGGAGH